ncbi:DHA2 family efflux MFS transporter permease subunit [Nocardioides panacihumi]|uniref:DHA2 family efflux MFS transporter permease subunit n=1 Tax=Nocardioides panacihumi TaxID=400774 RepID=A0ABN2QF85_9ACTN
MTTTLDRTRPAAQQAARSTRRRADRPKERGGADRRHTLALGLLVSAQFTVMLDTSIVNVALPSIQSDLGLRPAGVAWIVNAYVLAFGALLVLSGRVADLFGRRRMFIGGSAMFTVGTLLAAAASNEGLLLGGRIIQGAGAAALSPAAMSLLLLTFPGPARARAMSLWGAASAVGGATGVFLGGLLTGAFGWQAVFLVTVPVSMTAVVLARRVLEEGVLGVRHRFDTLGAVTVTGAVVALVHGALGLAESGLTVSTVTSLAASVALIGAFIRIERRAAEPLVPLDLFADRVVSTGVGLAVLGGSARASSFVLVALYLQQDLGLDPQHAGLAMVPTSVTGFVVSLTLLPRVLRVLGPRLSLVTGMVVLASGHLWLAYAPSSAGYAVAVLPGLLLVATGVAFSFTPTTIVIAGALPDAHAGLASGLAGSATQVGSALGTSVFTAIGIAVGGTSAGALGSSGFTAAFTAAAMVSLATAAWGCSLVGRRRESSVARLG